MHGRRRVPALLPAGPAGLPARADRIRRRREFRRRAAPGQRRDPVPGLRRGAAAGHHRADGAGRAPGQGDRRRVGPGHRADPHRGRRHGLRGPARPARPAPRPGGRGDRLRGLRRVPGRPGRRAHVHARAVAEPVLPARRPGGVRRRPAGRTARPAGLGRRGVRLRRGRQALGRGTAGRGRAPAAAPAAPSRPARRRGRGRPGRPGAAVPGHGPDRADQGRGRHPVPPGRRPSPAVAAAAGRPGRLVAVPAPVQRRDRGHRAGHSGRGGRRLPGRLLGRRPAPGAPGRLRADRRGGGGRHAAVAVRLLDALRRLRRAVHRAGAGPPGWAAAPGRAPPSARAAAGGQRGRGGADRGAGRAPVRRRDPAAGLDHPGRAGGPADPARVLRGHRLLVPDHQRRPVRPGRGGLPGHGGLLRDPAGPDRRAEVRLAGLRADTALWRSQFAAASYVWLEWDNQGRIAWTPALYAYFTSHFRLLGVVDGSGAHDVPEGGLYVRR